MNVSEPPSVCLCLWPFILTADMWPCSVKSRSIWSITALYNNVRVCVSVSERHKKQGKWVKRKKKMREEKREMERDWVMEWEKYCETEWRRGKFAGLPWGHLWRGDIPASQDIHVVVASLCGVPVQTDAQCCDFCSVTSYFSIWHLKKKPAKL